MSKRQIGKIVVRGFIAGVALGLISQFSLAAVSAATEKQHGVTVTKLEVNSNDQVGFKVQTTLKTTALLFAKPNTDYTEDDFVNQKKGTRVYRLLPQLRPGTSTTWEVHAYNPKTTLELFVKNYRFNHYLHKVVKVDPGSCGSHQTETYLEIHPKKGGTLRVKSVRARTVVNDKVKWVNMILALTDEETGDKVYVKTFKPGVRVTHLDTSTVYGATKAATAGCLGD
ncbi:MAG: hypothetical protein ABJA64_03175 [Candidatus Saccharibacteria bacterium]